MDKLTKYRDIIRRELQEFAEWLTRLNDTTRYEVVFDPDRVEKLKWID